MVVRFQDFFDNGINIGITCFVTAIQSTPDEGVLAWGFHWLLGFVITATTCTLLSRFRKTHTCENGESGVAHTILGGRIWMAKQAADRDEVSLVTLGAVQVNQTLDEVIALCQNFVL